MTPLFLESLLSRPPQQGNLAGARAIAAITRRRIVVAVSFTVNLPAVLDSRSTRQPRERAGRDEKMLSAEPKDHPKERSPLP
jgi:hypothetical protein